MIAETVGKRTKAGLAPGLKVWERETSLELATCYLEGSRSTN
jgi:hypothetical protein